MKQLILTLVVFAAFAFTTQAQTVTTIDFTNPATPTWTDGTGTAAQMNVGGVMMWMMRCDNILFFEKQQMEEKRITYTVL